MRDRRTRTPFIVSILVHVLLLLAWTATDLLLNRAHRRAPIEAKDDGFVFELIETPDFLPEEKPDAPTNLVSDRSTRAADENPMTTQELHIPYSPGEFMFKTYDEPAAQASGPGGEQRPGEERPEGEIGDLAALDMGDLASIDLLKNADSDRHYRIPARSVDFRNLVSSLTRQGGVSFNTYEWDFAPYMLAMKRKVEKNLHPPYAFTHMGMVSGTTILSFTVLRDGTVRGLVILGSDAHFSLDRTSVRAIELSMPFLPLPRDFPEDVLEVTAQFSYILR